MKARKLSLKVLMVAVFITCFAVGAVHAQVPNLSIWANTWFKVTVSETTYHFSNIGVKPTPGYPVTQSDAASYLKITGWDTTTPGAEFLIADVYAKDAGIWILAGTLNIFYFAGSNLKFIGSCRFENPAGVTLNLLIVFTGRRNKANTNFIMDGTTKLGTTGSSIVEIDDFPGSTERWAGSVKIGGPMVPVSKLPLALQGR